MRRKRKILFILDPLEKLDPELDSSLGLLREMAARGYETWTADVPDIYTEDTSVWGHVRLLTPRPGFRYQTIDSAQIKLDRFNLILIRKEPPFDAAYLSLTYMLELISHKVPVSNHPAGIRNTNEKMGILHFKKWLPRTLVSSSPPDILDFQKKLNRDLVVKPLELKGGRGIFRLKVGASRNKSHQLLIKATSRGLRPVMAQEFLSSGKLPGDKRILVLDGKILTAYEKHFKKGEFRSNLSLGGTLHPAGVSMREEKMVREMRPYLQSQGLDFVGIDVMLAKLIEINVTCPAGVMEAQVLYPGRRLVQLWADSLEKRLNYLPRKLRTR